MARLLDDASLLAGKEFKMGNFADIIEAIHVIQENMGVTGTTAQEASETINGSIASWKSALDNLLTGIGRNENIDQLVDNLVASTEDVIANLVPAIRRASEGFMQVMRVAVVRIGPQVLDAFRDIWNNKLPGMLTSAANGIIGLINDIFGTNIPKIETIELPSWGDISAKVILWAETVRNRIRTIAKWSIGIFTEPTETATEMTATFTTWWKETAKPAILSISTWALNLFGMPEADENTIKAHVGAWWEGVVTWVQNACVWTLQIFGFAPDAAKNAVDAISTWFGGVVGLLGDTLKLIFDWGSGKSPLQIKNDALAIFDGAKALIGTSMQIVWDLVPPKLQETIGGLIGSLQTFWNENKEGIMGLFDPENSAIAGFVSWISDLLSDPKFGETLVETVEAFLGAVKTIADALFTEEGKDTVAAVLNLIKSVLYLIEPVLSTVVGPALNAIAGVIQTIADALAVLSGKYIPVTNPDGTISIVPLNKEVEELREKEKAEYFDDVWEHGGDLTLGGKRGNPVLTILKTLFGGNKTPMYVDSGNKSDVILAIEAATEDRRGYTEFGTPIPEGFESTGNRISDEILLERYWAEQESSQGGGGGGKPGARTEDVVTELEIVKGELQGLRADLIAAVNSLANRPIAVNGKIITDIVGQGILRKARATFG